MSSPGRAFQRALNVSIGISNERGDLMPHPQDPQPLVIQAKRIRSLAVREKPGSWTPEEPLAFSKIDRKAIAAAHFRSVQ